MNLTHSIQASILALSLLLAPSITLHAQTTLPPRIDQAQALGQQLFLDSGSTGMVMVIVRGQEIDIHGYGETAPGSGTAPTATSILRLCSISKVFATDLLSRLVQDKVLTLDEPLQRFAPPHVVVPSRPGHPITLQQLATHTSGLPREVGPRPHDAPRFTFPGYQYRWDWLPRQHLRTVPGTAALYSNIGFDLLGDAIQRAAHKPYAALLAQRVTGPLAMKETGFTPTPAQCQRLLQGAHDEGPCTDTQSSAASAGLYSTASDISRWLQYLLGTGTPAIPAQAPAAQAIYLDPATLVSQSGLDHAGSPSGIGLGWLHLLDQDNPRSITEKTGGGAGFLTYVALNQPNHTGIFLALTDGAIETHLNVFKAANNLLLALNNLPPFPPDPPRPAPKPKRKPVRKRPTR